MSRVLILNMDVMAGRDPKGRFVKGTHWRPRKAHWDRDWLVREYVERQRSAADIAADQGCGENNILYWLAKHGISARDMATIRKDKKWGSVGATNPMFGRFGALNSNYVDGSSPERQRLYVRAEGRAFLRAVYERDAYRCARCGTGKTRPRSLHAHHIRPWAGNPALRFDLANAVTVCRPCHGWIHSKQNTGREYLA